MKLQKATMIGMGLGAALYLIGSAVAYGLQAWPMVSRPAELGLKLVNLPALYIGVNCFPHFFFNASNASLLFYTLAINLPLAGAVGAAFGSLASVLARRRQGKDHL